MEATENKFALITGASKGIGRAVSLALAREGYSLIICARNQNHLEEFHQQLNSTYPEIEVIIRVCDFSVSDQLNQLLQWLVEEHVDVHVLVNNVGLFQPGSLFDDESGSLEKHMQVNLYTPYRLSASIGKQMRERKEGHIFNISSVASREAVPAAAAYSVTKYALAGLTAVLRLELNQDQVKVTEIIPGSTLTSSWEGIQIPASEFVLPEDIAAALLSILKMSSGANVDEILIRPLHGQVS